MRLKKILLGMLALGLIFVFFEVSIAATLFEENWEDGINESLWKSWGSPAPKIIAGEGIGNSKALDPDGDSSHQSGLTSYERFELKEGLSVGAWFKGNYSANPWQNTWLSLGSEDAASTTQSNIGGRFAGMWFHDGLVSYLLYSCFFGKRIMQMAHKPLTIQGL